MSALKNVFLFVAIAGVMYGGYSMLKSEETNSHILESEISTRNKSHNEFDKKLAEINADLNTLVVEQDGKIALGPGSPNESNITTQERITRNLALVKNIMEQNKKQIKKLDGDRNRLKLENQSLTNLVDQDSEILASYETEIDSLYEEIAYQDMRVEELEEKMDLLQVHNELLQMQTEDYKADLNTAFFVCKPKKVLMEQKIVSTKGGVLGIGKRTIPGSVDEDKFTRIDKKTFYSIAVRGEKPKLLSFHPDGSYEFRKENNMNVYLHILNPDKFWAHTRFAIVSVK